MIFPMEALSVQSFLHLVFVAFVALFPPVNPIGSAIIVGPFFRGHSEEVRKKAALTIALYCLALCLVVAAVGIFIFKLFGLSVPVVQIAGGFLIARMGFGILVKNESEDGNDKVVEHGQISPDTLYAHLFYPLAFPTTTGGGTMAVLLALSANNFDNDMQVHLFNFSATAAACALMAALIYVCYNLAPIILEKLNSQAVQVCIKLTGFLTLCVGLQIIVNGLTKLLPMLTVHM